MLGLGQSQVANLQAEIKSGHVDKRQLVVVGNQLRLAGQSFPKIKCENADGARRLLAILQAS